ncbi:MAG: type II toxin-antitoxin system HicB family antitoxin [Desulfobulbus sp.]|nr:type II toxin-antitoxin system HicB family antitoxin [Desulfobulbus sp.]
MQKAYYAVFIPDEGKVSVLFPDVPGCVTWGENTEHAFAMAIEALEGHLEALADDGDPLPEPSGRAEVWVKFEADCASMSEPVPDGSFLQMVPAPDLDASSVRINVSFKRYLLDRIDRKATAAGMTRSGFLAAASSYEAGI